MIEGRIEKKYMNLVFYPVPTIIAHFYTDW